MPGTYDYLEEDETTCQVSTLVELICSISNESAQKIVEQHFSQANAPLLARCPYVDVGQLLFVVQLLPAGDEGEHTVFLHLALQEGIIEAYEYVTCYLMSIFLNPSRDRREHMRYFPLRVGESWLPAFDHPNKIYLCLDRPFMASNQVNWLIEHRVDT